MARRGLLQAVGKRKRLLKYRFPGRQSLFELTKKWFTQIICMTVAPSSDGAAQQYHQPAPRD